NGSTGTGTTATFGSPALYATDGTSFVIGFVGASAGSIGTPTELTTVTHTSTTPDYLGMDSNSGVTSWSGATATVASGAWDTYVLEVLGYVYSVNTFTLKQVVYNVSASGTTCPITLQQSIGAGDLLVYGTFMSDGYVTSSS